jgi:hypothetical protein
MEDLNRNAVKQGFLLIWKRMLRGGLVLASRELSDESQKDSDWDPNTHTFLSFGLVSRFFNPDLDPLALWEQRVSQYLEAQILIEKAHRV